MSILPLFTKYAYIGQGILSVKEIPNHVHSIYGVDWELIIPVVRFPMETVQRGTRSQTNTWTPLMHSELCKENTQPWTQPLRS